MKLYMKMTLRKKLMWLSVGSVMFATIVIMTISAINTVNRGLDRVNSYKKTLLSERMSQIRGYVEMAVSQIKQLPLEEAKKAVLSMRYAENGYLWVHDYDNVVVVHPDSSFVGIDQSNLKDSNGVYMVNELTKMCRESGEGFIKYSWRLKDEEILRPKLSFAKVFAQYQWIVATGIYIDDIDKAVEKENEHMIYTVATTITIQFLMALAVAFVLMLTSKYFVTTYITGPLESITLAMKSFKNDLTISVPVSSDDEVGTLGVWFNDLIGKLRHSVVMVSGVTNNLHSHAAAISSNMQQQSSFAVELASSVTEITSTMEELSSSAAQIAQHSQGVVAQTDKTLEQTREGAQEVENLTAKIDHINQDMQLNLKEIVALGSKSKEINKIMEIINNIANQTRLIAFNAALEAASAGEVGKRFGVVAVEIRRLADSVVESTAEIEGKITEILDAVNRLVISSEKTSVMMQQGQVSSINTVSMLMNMVDGVEISADSARQISLSTQQQQIASTQVLLAIKEIEQGVRQSTDSAHQSNLVAGELVELADRLKSLVKNFKIDSSSDKPLEIKDSSKKL
ncbi:MAG: methyl-accepting chemotaxis protein [Desulfamplus sp.]|nr:methyl-accepting chemotaxis protein [Desulfamplus sp.]